MYTSIMRYLTVIAALVMVVAASDVSAQRRRAPAHKPAPPPPPKVEPAEIKCPEPLGVGVKTGAAYCFVLAGSDPAAGVRVTIPPHVDTAAVLFDLHNRHTYSDEDIRAGRGFSKYTAVVAVLTMKGDLLDRGAVQTEFRTGRDLYERISGGAGPGGVKAVAPIGNEAIRISIPAAINEVSILGEMLEATTPAGHETATPGRTVAVISNVRVEYRPAVVKAPGKK
jgi:hypothetical protein